MLKSLKFIFFLFLLSLESCSNSPLLDTLNEGVSVCVDSRSVDTEYATQLKSNWYSMAMIRLHPDDEVVSPWNINQAGTLPLRIINDFSPEDGWVLVNETISSSMRDFSYLMFLNKYTGRLRVLYYHEAVISSGGTGAWNLRFSPETSFLNLCDFFSFPNDIKDINGLQLMVTNNSESLHQAIGRGWNCFETELNFDVDAIRNQNKFFTISSYDTNISKITLSGEYTSKSSGTITSTTSKNLLRDGFNVVTTSLGDSAKTWITSNIAGSNHDKSPIKIGVNALSSIVQGGVKELVSAGVDKLFGSFIGLFNKTKPTKQKLEFTTNGNASYSGEMVSQTANNVISWNAIPAQRLGLWTIDTTPIVIVGKYGTFRETYIETPPFYLEKEYFLDGSSFKVYLNSELKNDIKDIRADAELMYVDVLKGDENWRNIYKDVISLDNIDWTQSYFPNQKVLYESADGNFILKDAGKSTYGIERYITNIRPTSPYTEIPGLSPKYIVRVTLTIETLNGNVVVLGRNYLPNYVLKDNRLPSFVGGATSPNAVVHPEIVFF